ncbi:putative ribonuclease H-like domain-containing protein [Tanacetum coccineum]
MKIVPSKDYILLPLWTADLPFSQSSKSSPNVGFRPSGDDEKKVTEEPGKEGGDPINVVGRKASIELPDDPNMPALEDIVYSDDDDDDVGAKADMNNLDAFMPVSPIPTTRVHKDHPVEQIIGDLNSAPQIRRMTKNLEEHGLFSSVQQRTNHKDFQNCLFAYFLSQVEPKKVWTLVDLPNGKRSIGTKWVFRNKKDERGIVIKNKARLVAQEYTQEEGIDYDEVWKRIFKKRNKKKAKSNQTKHGMKKTKPNCIKSMLAIPHLSQVSSMAEIDSKEAQKKSMAGIRALKSLTKETQERRAEDLALSINRRLCEPKPEVE